MSAEAAVEVAADFSAWSALASAGPIVKFTFLILLGMSVFSWMIIVAKHILFKKTHEANEKFIEDFWKASTLDEMADKKEDYEGSSLFQVFTTGFKEIKKIRGAQNEGDGTNALLSKTEALERALRTAVETELFKVESRLSFLATTGSTAPFIGLFGTVWGILTSFQKIGAMKSASLAVVAPGISEALIATAVGLAAAIPASIAYNHYINKVRKSEHELNGFANDLLNISERNFF